MEQIADEQINESDSMSMLQEINEKSIDPASQIILHKAEQEGIETAWDRYEKQIPQCSFG